MTTISAAPDGPCIIQSDLSVLVEVDHHRFEEAREVLARFAELVKSPERMHTYRITPLSLWNAAAAGFGPDWILPRLEAVSRYSIPTAIRSEIIEQAARYGKLVLRRDESGGLLLEAGEPMLAARLEKFEAIQSCLAGRSGSGFVVHELQRGRLKHAMVKLGYPIRDLAGYTNGTPFHLSLRGADRAGRPFGLRDYQRRAVESFLGPAEGPGAGEGGSGVVAMPCGAGKTIVGLGVMERLGCHTLILAANIMALRQWREEILDKTGIPAELIGEYSGEKKEIRPVTIATYQVITYRSTGQAGTYPHYDLFNSQDWGLIVYDEVHLLPAPIFQITAALQARRRLGLTATLIREDGREDEVFSLIGPKRYDIPWRTLEENGWIAQAQCFEVRVPFSDDKMLAYATEADDHVRFRLAAENPAKEEALAALLARHQDDRVLIIGQYLDHLEHLAERFGLAVLTGRSASATRERLFRDFREGRLLKLVVSSIANIAVDLPEANCAIQVSGRFGSRQEEAQRLGRVLRPKRGANKAFFYTLVTQDTDEQAYARHRQLFLAEQGYRYTIMPAASLSDLSQARN
ncbi:MAG: DEAD/DEAH box helicase [Elusimicrobia bacterium]|nr:DEAD/DEAH box helicase [Elusimicrobiota bacterium]